MALMKYTTATLTDMLFGALVFIVVTAIAQYHWKRRRLYKMAAKVPGLTTYPIIGSAHLFAKPSCNVLQTALDLAIDNPMPCKFWLGQHLVFGTSKPEHYEIILNHPKALAKAYVYGFLKPLFGDGLFTSPVDIWKRHRKFVMPTLNTKFLSSFVPIFAEHSDTFADIIREKSGQKIDIFEYMEKCALDFVCETAMGYKANSQRKDEQFGIWLTRALEIGFYRMYKFWYHPDIIFYNSPLGKEFQDLVVKISKFTDNVVRTKKELYFKRKQNAIDFPEAQLDCGQTPSLLDLLIKLSEEEAKVTDDELRDEANTFLIAGSDTTAATCCYVFLGIAMHPDVQQKVYEEILDVLGPHRPVEFSDMPLLKYTERVIKETMRLFPIGPIILRELEGDVELDNYTLPKGGTMIMGILHTHRNPLYWKDPLKFDPDRFLPEEVAKRHPYAYVPFAAGPRICIGPRYAMIALKVVLAQVMRKFSMSTTYKEIAEIKLRQDVILKPIDGWNVTLHLRES